MLEIGMKSEYVFSFFGLLISNSFFTTFLVTVVIILVSVIFYKNVDNGKSVFIKTVKLFVSKLYAFIDSIIDDEKMSEVILPLVATFFIFILTANIFALIPGFLGSVFLENSQGTYSLLRSPNSDLTTTLALAVISVFSIQYFSLKTLGFRRFLSRFLNFRSPLKFVLGFFEMISEFVKVLSFSFRLFGNVFAGEVLLLVMAFLVPYFIPVPFMLLEVFVGFVQAFIFAVLTITFARIGMVKHEK